MSDFVCFEEQKLHISLQAITDFETQLEQDNTSGGMGWTLGHKERRQRKIKEGNEREIKRHKEVKERGRDNIINPIRSQCHPFGARRLLGKGSICSE